MSDPILGMVVFYGCNFAPRGWAFCNGAILPISQNTALFSLLGTTFGGDGRTTFALPNLQGRSPIGFGQGPGLSDYALGETAGVENVTLNSAQIPAHSHFLQVANQSGNITSPTNAASIASYMDLNGDGGQSYTVAAPNVALSPQTVGMAGGNAAHNNRQPYLGLNFCIAMQGVYPQRN